MSSTIRNDVVLAAERFQALQPFHARGVQAAFALHRLDDDGCGELDAARGILDHALEILDAVHAVDIAIEGHHGRAVQGHAGGAAVVLVAGGGERAGGDAVETVREADHVGAAGGLAGDLQGRLDGVGAGRAGELE